MKHSFPGRYGAIAALVAASIVAGCGSDDDSNGAPAPAPVPAPAPTSAVEIRTVSNRADLVSGGDALVQVVLPAGTAIAGLKVDVDGRDVTGAFAQRPDGRITGLVTGLRTGDNILTAKTDTTRAAQLTITNSPKGGPVLSGPQVTPFICATPTPQPASGTVPATNASGLGTAATDAQCNIATEYKLYYKTTTAGCSFALPDPSPNVPATATTVPAPAPAPANPCFKPYTAGAPAPADMATTTTDAGVTVPYIVRVERGTLNRGIYDIAVLFDPARPAWTGVAPQPQWNGKVYFQFGASTGQPRRQLRPAPAWTDDKSLSRGFMVVQNSMSDSLQNSNRVMMAETVMMMKEHIAEQYGPIKYAMSVGSSGGSINSNMNASIMPGQLDGFTIGAVYPDSDSTGIEVGDCVLLVEAYQKPAWLNLMNIGNPGGYTQAQVNAKKAAINGHPDQTGCHGWYNAFGSNAKAGTYFQRVVSPASSPTGAITQSTTLINNCQLPNSVVYDPTNNPNGPRCNTWSWSESIYGKVPGTPFARDTRDNVGVQYGLKALQSGAITPEEFVTINEAVGGLDRDSNLIPTRNAADEEALATTYRAGIVMSGRNLAKTAVIDMRGWDDSALITPPGLANPPSTPIHFVWRSFAVRDRLVRDFGDFGSQALWRFGRTGLGAPTAVQLDAFLTMDLWLTRLKADTGNAPIEQKVRSARPAQAADYCLLSTDAAQSTRVTDQAVCDADPFLRPSASPRQVAGGPRAEDVMKCQLKPLNVADYAPVTFTAGQVTRLQAVFPSGVCDWSKPGVAQQPAVSPLTFKAGPGGQPLPAAPVSRPQ